MKIYGICAAFCVGMFALVFALERAASGRALLESKSFDAVVADATAAWARGETPSSEREITVFVSDALDDDSLFGAEDSWSSVARALAGRLLAPGRKSWRSDLAASALAFDWRTESLAWASDRDAQYGAIAGALAAADVRHVRLNIVAHGRGARTLLAALRHGGAAPRDRILVLGVRPAAGDEKLGAALSFIYPTPGGPELASRNRDGSMSLTHGDLPTLLAERGAGPARNGLSVSPARISAFAETGENSRSIDETKLPSDVSTAAEDFFPGFMRELYGSAPSEPFTLHFYEHSYLETIPDSAAGENLNHHLIEAALPDGRGGWKPEMFILLLYRNPNDPSYTAKHPEAIWDTSYTWVIACDMSGRVFSARKAVSLDKAHSMDIPHYRIVPLEPGEGAVIAAREWRYWQQFIFDDGRHPAGGADAPPRPADQAPPARPASVRD